MQEVHDREPVPELPVAGLYVEPEEDVAEHDERTGVHDEVGVLLAVLQLADQREDGTPLHVDVVVVVEGGPGNPVRNAKSSGVDMVVVVVVVAGVLMVVWCAVELQKVVSGMVVDGEGASLTVEIAPLLHHGRHRELARPVRPALATPQQAVCGDAL